MTTNLPSYPNSLQNYQVVLYKKALHPEFFSLKGRRLVSGPDYDTEVWVMPASHVIRLSIGSFITSELVTDHDGPLPAQGSVFRSPCAGEHDFEHEFESVPLSYSTSIQTETLPDNIYRSSYDEIVDLAKETNALVHAWPDAEGRKCISVLDVQAFRDQFHAQSYHLIASQGLVLRSQSVFEFKDKR